LTSAISIERRLSFGSVAELYDRARPSYPHALVDDVVAYARVGPGDRTLDVGAGTGKATELFAARGLEVLALEPSPRMAEVAGRRLSRFDNVAILETEFERWEPEHGQFGLVYSAQAWHWIRPEVAYERVRQALEPAGALAVFWNRPRWDRVPIRDELNRVYQAVPEFDPKVSPMRPHTSSTTDWVTDWDSGHARGAGFAEPLARDYTWSITYQTGEYLDLLQTASDHVRLPEAARRRLLNGITLVLDRNGGAIEIPYATHLIMARIMGSLEP
jgi:SAM-dependent methyltransferase